MDGIFLGGEDLTNALGARRTAQGTELEWARSMVLFAARAAGIAAFDTICPEFRDLSTLQYDAVHAAALGYDGKFAIHPAQVPIINDVFTPAPEAIAKARAIVAAFADNPGVGVVGIGGVMYDRPHLRRAEQLLARVKS